MIVVIGAGISGLTAGHFLKKEYLVLEKEPVAGGLATEYPLGTYRFPYGGHYFHFFHKAHVLRFVKAFMGFRRFRRNSRVLLENRFIPFPIQYHLAHLPARERRVIADQMLAAGGGDNTSLERFLFSHFGERLVRLFFNPFLEKFYCQRISGLLANMDKGSIPIPRKQDVVAGLRGKRFFRTGYNPVFYYPATRSLQDFIGRYAAPLKKRLHFNQEVIRVDLGKREVLTGRDRVPFRFLINTAPLNQFLQLCHWQEHGRRLRHVSTLVVNAVIRQRRRRFHWLYLPETSFPFYRAGYYPTSGHVLIYLERSLTKAVLPPEKEVREAATQTLLATGMIDEAGEIVHLDMKLIPVSYVIFDAHWPNTVPPLLRRLQEMGVWSIGRYGSWNYTSMSDDMQQAMETAQLLNER